jgi:flagellum-specific peptidoglycan hydrolase FlgJ
MNTITEFFKALRDSNLRQQGWDLLILYTQFMCECGGDSELLLNANNPFSVKAGSTWTGDTYLLKNNPEVINGKAVILPDIFRKYPSLIAAILDYAAFIERRFPHSFALRNKYNEYVYNLINGEPYKYATDPLYVEEFITKYNELNVNDFKEALNGAGENKMWPEG